MAILAANLDYTSKDYASITRRVFALIRTVFPDWTNQQVVDFGNILVESFAFIFDHLMYYQDNQAQESRWSTARLRKSLVSMAKLIGFTARGATAATVTETFTLSQAASADVVIERGRKVRTAAALTSVAFQLLEELTIPAGQTVATATVEHSVFEEDQFESNETGTQRFQLTKAPYLDDSEEGNVVAANGSYEVVDNLLGSSATDLHCTRAVDQNNLATFTFGDGVNGRIPLGTITIGYKTGGGAVGQLNAGALSRLDGTVTDVDGNVVRCTVTNAAETEGGAERQGTEAIRQLAPLSLRVLTRAVAREDFEIGATGVTGVARALHLTRNEDSSIGENRGVVYVVPDDYGAASSTLLDTVKARFIQVAGYDEPDLPALSTYQLDVISAVYLDVDFQVKVHKRKGKTPAQVKAAILASLAAYFTLYNDDGSTNDELNFGYYIQDLDGEPTGTLAFSDLYNLVRDTAGVAKIADGDEDFLVNEQRRDVAITARQFPRLGSVIVIDADTGQTIP